MTNLTNVSVTAWTKALHFAAVNGGLDFTPLVRREHEMVQVGNLPSYVYQHRLYNQDIPIVMVHGMSPLGADDPRVDRCARALAATGYRVYVPQLESLQQLRITPSTADELAQYVTDLATERSLCPAGQVAMVAASFSASLALNVAARPDVEASLVAILSIGAFGCIDTLIPYLLTAPDADPYGAAIVMANFASAVLAEGDSLARLYYYKALHLFRPAEPEARDRFDTALNSASLRTRSAYWQVEHHRAYREEIAHRILAAVPSICTALNVCEHVATIQAPLFLIHGADDVVVPPGELDELSAALTRNHKTFQALRSHLLGHGDADLQGSITETLALTRLLAGYFGAIRPRRMPANHHLTLSEQH